MCEIRRKYDAEFKKNAVKLSYASSKSVGEIADDLGINDGMLYRWRRRYTADGNKTVFAARDEELKKLRLENEKRRPASRSSNSWRNIRSIPPRSGLDSYMYL